MKKIDLSRSKANDALIDGAKADSLNVTFGKKGGGLSLHGAAGSSQRYLIGDMEITEDHSTACMLRFYAGSEKEARLIMRFGLLPYVKTRVCFDMELLDNHTIYTNRTPGLLKLVCHGHRIEREECSRIELGIEETFHDVGAVLSDFHLSDCPPGDYPLPKKKLVDEFGQWKGKAWPGKIQSVGELTKVIRANEGEQSYPFANWDKWGGCLDYKIQEGTGFFTTAKKEGRWYLVDPDGYSYFSMGVCGAGRLTARARIDGLEDFCEWLPDRNAAYEDMYRERTYKRTPYMEEEGMKLFDFTSANLYKVYGDTYREMWQKNQYHTLMSNGINSSGNHPGGHWALPTESADSPIPFAHHLGRIFPDTEKRIFRDFPDVLSPEYEENSRIFAEQLRPLADNPMLIGYFMRNEPEFNFVEDVIIADEVLYNPSRTYCRSGLKKWLVEKYTTIDDLNSRWKSTYSSFNDFDRVIRNCSATSEACAADLREFSRHLVKEYIRIPAQACKRVDPHHLNLGVRWSKAFNEDLCAGWEYMDVFSINCYSFDPGRDMDFAVKAGVDRPILIGEFHFGALDRGLTATGLKGVADQKERARAWKLFVQKCAEHPNGVGTHWFQLHDQFCLGRFDGENYQIGLLDVCTRPYPEMMEAIRETGSTLYEIRQGRREAGNIVPRSIPMIGY